MIWRRVLSVFLGGVSFWTLTTALELLTRRELNLLVGTFVPAIALVSVYLLLRRRLGMRHAGLWMLAGVFLLGPLYCMVGSSAFGGGFVIGNKWENLRFLLIASFVPPLTLELASYDGTLFGVLLVALLLPIVQWRINKR